MKVTLQRSRRRAFLIFPFLVLPLLHVAPSGATRPAQQTSPAAAAVARDAPDTSGMIKLTVTVSGEKGEFITGLTKDAFAVFEGKSQREVSYFNHDEVPASVGILIDVSGSMRAEDVHAAKQTTARFIQRSDPNNEYFIGEFNREWRELADWTRDEGAIIEGLRKATKTKSQEGETKKRIPYWRTALYDACFAALGKLASGAHPKRVLFIITDGNEDNASTHKFSELQNLIRSSGVLIYAVCLSTLNSPAGWQQEKIHELTALSGGRSYFPSKGKEVEEVIDRMALELRCQYVVGFAPTNSAPSGKWNKVKIKVTPPVKIKNLFVRSREGYFSPVTTPAP